MKITMTARLIGDAAFLSWDERLPGEAIAIGHVPLSGTYSLSNWLSVLCDAKRVAVRLGRDVIVPAIGHYPATVISTGAILWMESVTLYNRGKSGETAWADAPDVPGYCWEKYRGGYEHLVPVAERGIGYTPGLLC